LQIILSPQVKIEQHKLNFSHVSSKCGSKDNLTYSPGGGKVSLFGAFWLMMHVFVAAVLFKLYVSLGDVVASSSDSTVQVLCPLL